MILLDTETTNKAFGQFIKRGRKKKDLYQKEVAKMLNITQAYYSQIESGKREIGVPMALNICKLLDLDINVFVASLAKKKASIKRQENDFLEESAE